MEKKKYPRFLQDRQTPNLRFNPSKWIYSEEDEFGYVKKNKRFSYWRMRTVIGTILGVISLLTLAIQLIQFIINKIIDL
jgi:hypothetical protein